MASILAFVVPPFIAFRRIKGERDGLKLKLERQPKLIMEVQDLKEEPWVSELHRDNIDAAWWRIEVRNIGGAIAQGCHAIITKFFDMAGRMIPSDPIALHWIGTGWTYPYERVPISQTEPRHLDVLVQTQNPVSPPLLFMVGIGQMNLGPFNRYLSPLPKDTHNIEVTIYSDTESCTQIFEIIADEPYVFKAISLMKSPPATFDKAGSQT